MRSGNNQPFVDYSSKAIVNKGTALSVSLVTPLPKTKNADVVSSYSSINNQTLRWHEWVIIKKPALEETVANHWADLAIRDNRIKFLDSTANDKSTNIGSIIAAINSDYICFFDESDLLAPEYLETACWSLYTNNDYGLCLSDPLVLPPRDSNQPESSSWEQTDSRIEFIQEGFAAFSTAVVRKSSLVGLPACLLDMVADKNGLMLMLTYLIRNGDYIKLAGNYFKHLGLYNVPKPYEPCVLPEPYCTKKALSFPASSLLGDFKPPRTSDLVDNPTILSSKTNILMLLQWMTKGGADNYNLSIAAKLDKEMFDINVIATKFSANELRSMFSEHANSVFELPNFLKMTEWPAFISYIIETRNIDVIFLSNSQFGYYLLPWIRKEFPAITIIDYVHNEEWYWMGGGYGRLSGVMGDVTDLTLTGNTKTQRILTENFSRDPDHVKVLFTGVDTVLYDPEKIPYGRIRQNLNIDNGHSVVLFPCRFTEQKRPFLMLEIAKSLKEQNAPIVIVAVGDGPLLADVQRTIASEGLSDTVLISTEWGHLLEYYRDSDITLICSIKEGLALTTYESLSMGVPVITADAGGQTDLVDSAVGAVLPLLQNEVTGYGVHEYSEAEVKQYVDAILSLLSDPAHYETIAANCRPRVMHGFTVDEMIERFQSIVLELLNDEYRKKHRARLSNKLNSIASEVDEIVTLWTELENSRYEAAAVYKEATWLSKELTWHAERLREVEEESRRTKNADHDTILTRLLRRLAD
ncbi:MAG: glycosyltransferase [Coriobacteriales bacterium]|nr:glycosyltransferase [Coriobacteriales bacterium]